MSKFGLRILCKKLCKCLRENIAFSIFYALGLIDIQLKKIKLTRHVKTN